MTSLMYERLKAMYLKAGFWVSTPQHNAGRISHFYVMIGSVREFCIDETTTLGDIADHLDLAKETL